MQPISTDTFLDQAKAAGIGYDPRYPAARSLIFVPPNENSRFWTRPERPSRWPHFVASLFAAAEASGNILVCPHRGTWPSLAGSRHPLDRTQAMLTEALGIPVGWPGAIEFDRNDRDRLIASLVVQFLEPVNDLYVLPLGGTTFLKFSHHAVVHVSCVTRQGVDSVAARMAEAGYELPNEVPDSTFKQPAWMQPTGGDV